MPPRDQRRPEPRWRRYFRRCRIGVLLTLFALTGALIYLNLVGLPDFLRRPLLEKLRERGLDLQIATLRWNFFRGIVAENVKFGRVGDDAGPRFVAGEAELNLNYPALLHRRIEITGVGLRDGTVTLPVGGTNEPGRVLTIERIRAVLLLLPDDAWSLEDFHASFAGADFFLTGAITNASAARDWPIFRSDTASPGDPKPGMSSGAVQRRLRKLADTLEKIRFTQPPEIRVLLSGDARDLESFALRLTIAAPGADTPWGRFANGTLSLRLRPVGFRPLPPPPPSPKKQAGVREEVGRGERATVDPPVERPQVELRLRANSVQTPWAEVANPNFELRLIGNESDTNRVQALLSARAAVVNTRWATATNAQFSAAWEHSLTNAIPLSGSGKLNAATVETRWIGAREVSLAATLQTLTNVPPQDGSLGPWQAIWPYALDWTARAARCDTEKLDAEEITLGGRWVAPWLEVTNLMVRFSEGRLDAQASLDAASRAAAFSLRSNFEPNKVRPFLTEKAERWLNRYSWQTPPHIAGSGTVVLPAWTNRQPEWRAEVLPTLRLDALVTATNAAYLKIPADWVRTRVTFTNQVWWLPDLVAGRPEGMLELAHRADDRTREYWFGLRSSISPEVLRAVLSTNAQRGLDYFKFSTPPIVSGGISGRWRDNASISFTGRVELADFSFREQGISRLVSELRYTNRFLEFLAPKLERGEEYAFGPGMAVDLDAQRIYLTNILSTTEPLLITRCIGPKTTAALEPYVFRKPPTVLVNGFAPLGRNKAADLRFDVEGGPFEWQSFKIPHIAGRVHWLNDSLGLSNMQMQAYGGTGAGAASFDLSSGAGTPFQFALGVTNVDLRSLMADIATRTNQLEGRLDGVLVVTNAYATNIFSWYGHGHAALRDGLIWSMPVFGVLSKPLDAVMPGLGAARISEGTASFFITNGVVFSDDLEMRAPTTRLQYVGAVDFAGRVNARVRAEPLRDTWVIGPLLRLALWPVAKAFEYKITGTLAEPQPEPLYIPKLLYKPFLHPLQTIEDIFTPADSSTNTPPQFNPPK